MTNIEFIAELRKDVKLFGKFSGYEKYVKKLSDSADIIEGLEAALALQKEITLKLALNYARSVDNEHSVACAMYGTPAWEKQIRDYAKELIDEVSN